MTYAQFKAQIIVPAERTNLIANPSFELATTGWTASGAGVSIAVSTTYQRRGAQSCEVTTATNVASGAYYAISLTSGTTYTFSLDVLDVAGQSFTLYFADNSGNLVGTATSWTGTGYWKRRAVSYTAASTATHRLYIIRASVASTTKYYIDGAQLEAGAESTYLDGDMTGFIPGETAYQWNGTRHTSTSWRSGQTRTGGTYVNVGTYARILNIAGLGMTPLANIAVPSSMGGSYYQNTIAGDRPFSLIVNFNGNGDYGEIARDRTALINALKPDLVTSRQPVMLQIDQLDGNGLEAAETLMLPAVYEGGLEMDGGGDNYNERAAINFRAYQPAIYQQGEKGIALGYQTAVSNFANIGYRDTDGQWNAMGTGATGGEVSGAVKMPDGSIIAGGGFTGMGGVANTANLAKWNGTAWSSVGVINGNVNALTVGADGSLYIGGNFTTAGGVTVNRVAKWNGSTWSALSTGVNNTVSGLVIGPDNALYVGGKFTTAGGVAVSCIAKWNGANWTSLGTGMATGVTELYVRDVAFGPDGYLYAVGDFTTAGGVTVNGVAKWTGAAWVALGTGVSGGFREVNTIAFGLDGAVYIGGGFNSAGGVTATNIARWNGSTWENIGNSSAYVYGLVVNAAGVLFGAVTSISGTTFPDNMATYFNGLWRPMDVNVNDVSAGIKTFLPLTDGRIYIGGLWTGTTATSATVTASNIGGVSSYPRITFTGPGTCWQVKNYTSGKAIYFNGLTLLAGEIATLDLDPLHISFTSTFRGNLMSTILPGSDLTFELLPGANNISAYMYGGTTAASKIMMTWRDGYWSTDGAVR